MVATFPLGRRGSGTQALVTGATGFVGHELVRQLHSSAVPVLAAIGPLQNQLERQRLDQLLALGVQMVDLDLRRERPFAVVPTEWNTLFHLAAYVQTERRSDDVHINDEGTRRLLSQLPLQGRRVVYSSTLAVADNTPNGRVEIDSVCRPRTDYGRSKLAAEHILREACANGGATFTIVRLPTIYGRGFRTNGLFDVLAHRLERQDILARLAWPGRLALLSAHDAACMLYRLAAATEARNRLFLASSNENPRVSEIAAAVASAKGLLYRPVPLPASVVSLMANMLRGWWQNPVFPHAVQIAAWRAKLLLTGLYCEETELPRLLGMKFDDWRTVFATMYGNGPVPACQDTHRNAARFSHKT